MDKSQFHQKDIFVIPVGGYFQKEEDEYSLVYSPLAKTIFLLDSVELVTLNKAFSGLDTSHPKLQSLLNQAKTDRKLYAESPQKTYALTVLPNNICNFNCSYCYAAKAHSNKELDMGALKLALNFFIDPQRLERRNIFISFGGGGEPFISWAIIKEAMTYASERAEKYGFTIGFSYASNGSIINSEIINDLKRFNVKANVSFDILPELQNLQRKNYELVCRTLDTMLDAGIEPTINSVITPQSVRLQEQMVEDIQQRFPRIKRLSFNPVVNGTLFNELDKSKDFYALFTRNFFRARSKGEKYGITLSSIKHHNLQLIKQRACAGGFDITPEGKISMCYFVSSPNERLYEDFIYGNINIDEGKIEIDSGKYEKMIHHRAENIPKCNKCFVKWHCAGGCYYENQTYSNDLKEVVCDFTRNFSKEALLEKLSHNPTESKDINLYHKLIN